VHYGGIHFLWYPIPGLGVAGARLQGCAFAYNGAQSLNIYDLGVLGAIAEGARGGDHGVG